MKNKILICAIMIVASVSGRDRYQINHDARLSPRVLNYQGYLTDTLGNPITNPSISMAFTIYDAISAGNSKWTETHDAVGVSKGIFHVLLGTVSSIPDSVFTANPDRWLEIAVAGQTLAPRTRIVSVPYAYTATYADTAIYARNGGGGADADWVISGSDMYSGVTGNVGIGTSTPRYKLDVFGVVCGGTYSSVSNPYSGLLAGWNNQSGFNESDTAAVCVGGWNNFAEYKYAFVGGGQWNHAKAPGAIVMGGYGDTASGEWSVIAGGRLNKAYGFGSGVGGGIGNLGGGGSLDSNVFIGGGAGNQTNEKYGAIGGGYYNIIEGQYATIGGGYNNNAMTFCGSIIGGLGNATQDAYATVGGGVSNLAGGLYSSVLGGANNQAYSSLESDTAATIVGGMYNQAMGNWSFIGGGTNNTIEANRYGSIVGGRFNYVTRAYGFVGGGEYNTAVGPYSSVTGGTGNYGGLDESDTAAFVGGGYNNRALAKYSFVGGGINCNAMDNYTTVVGGAANNACSLFAFVGGGQINSAVWFAATVGGGMSNTANMTCATVGGGYNNRADSGWTFVGGGQDNRAAGNYAVVSGGYRNRAFAPYTAIGGGYMNKIFDFYSTVGGGDSNVIAASGYRATIAGGFRNYVNSYVSTVGGGEFDSVFGPGGFAVGSHSVVPVVYNNSAAFNGQVVTASGQTRVNILSKATGTFSIDHPLDPENKILNHYFVESPEMVLIYRGRVRIGNNGQAVIHLPDYFDALNKNPMVQLTAVGAPETPYLVDNIKGNRFVIAGKPGSEVHWLVTGERKDASAEATKLLMPVEQAKTGELAGRSLDDNFLYSTMAQLEQMGLADKFQFRTAEARRRYEEYKQRTSGSR